MCVPGPIADRAYAACDYLLGRAHDACRRFDARLAIVTIPHPMQLTPAGNAELVRLSGRPELCDPTMPDRRFAAWCRQRGLPMVAGAEHLTRADYKRREGIHWNERGHWRVASIVRRLAESPWNGGSAPECAPVAIHSNLEHARP
jgi:hypothetical protein